MCSNVFCDCRETASLLRLCPRTSKIPVTVSWMDPHSSSLQKGIVFMYHPKISSWVAHFSQRLAIMHSSVVENLTFSTLKFNSSSFTLTMAYMPTFNVSFYSPLVRLKITRLGRSSQLFKEHFSIPQRFVLVSPVLVLATCRQQFSPYKLQWTNSRLPGEHEVADRQS